MKVKNSKDNNNLNQIKEFSNWICIAIFAITTVIYFSGQLFGDTFFWEDFTEYVYPVQTYAANIASEGSIPFWNPYVFSGMPFLADLQVGFFYPLNRLTSFFLQPDGHLSVWGLQFIIILHFFIAQIAFFFLMRNRGASQLASIFSAIAYSFSMMMVCHVFHPMIVYHLAWFPLVFMFFLKTLELGDYRFGIWAGLILGMSMLSGHPQITLYEVFFLGIYYLWYLIEKIKNKEKNLTKPIINGLATFIIAVGIFQVQFLISQELAGLSQRSDMSVENATEGSLEYKQILNFVNPHQFGKISGDPQDNIQFLMEKSDGENAPYYYYWETAFYFGVLTLLLGIIGLILTINSSFTKFLLTMIAVSFLYALGSNFIFHDIVNVLPFFGQFRNPTRMMMFAILGFAMLAGFGFDKLLKSEFNKIKKPILIAVSVVGVLIVLSLAGDDVSGVSRNTALMSLLYFMLGSAVVWALSNKKINYNVAGIVVIAVIFLDLYLAGSNFNSSPVNPEQYYRLDAKMLESFKDSPDDLFRVNTRSYNPPYMATRRNQGMVDRFRSTEGYNPLALNRINPALNTNDEVYNLLNVKYILKANPQTGDVSFAYNTDMLPNAWLVNKYQVFSEDEIGDKMRAGNFDFTQEVILEQSPGLSYKDEYSSQAELKCVKYKPNYLQYEINNCDENYILVLSEIWYPDWKVFIDDVPAKLLRANYSLRAVEIPKGTKKVEFRYASDLFAAGQWISIFTLLISLPLLIINLNGKNKKNEESTSRS